MTTYPHIVDNSKSAENDLKLQFATSSRRLIPGIILGSGILLIFLGIGWNYINSMQNTSIEGKGPNQPVALREIDQKVGTVAGSMKVKMIKVDVEGAVEKPGVVEVPYDSRSQDVLIAAGGLSPKADRMYVSKMINLAQKVADGMKLYIPFAGESAPITGNTSITGLTGIAGQDKLININSATASDLDSLPGVGAVTAEKIMAGRPYQDISELIKRNIVSNSIYLKIKDKINVY